MDQSNLEAVKRCAGSAECVPSCPYYTETGQCDQTRMMSDMLELLQKHEEKAAAAIEELQAEVEQLKEELIDCVCNGDLD